MDDTESDSQDAWDEEVQGSEPEAQESESNSREESTHFRDHLKRAHEESGPHNTGPIPRNPRSDQVFLVRGKDRGEPAWHYVLVDRNKLPLFRRAVTSGSLDVADFGEVIKSGWGEHPPDSVIQEIKEQYG